MTGDEKAKGSELNDSKALPEFSLVLISFWVKFWFVTAIPTYFNRHIFKLYVCYFYVPILTCIIVMK
jgi:hypothetical protein